MVLHRLVPLSIGGRAERNDRGSAPIDPAVDRGYASMMMGMRVACLLWLALAWAAIAAPCRAADGDGPLEDDVQVLTEVEMGAYAVRRLRFTVSGTSALTALIDADKIWGFSFGGSVGMTKSGPGLGGFLQIGYLSHSNHWEHAIPIDFGGQYRWGSHVKSFVVSGGMSFIALEPRKGSQTEGIFSLGTSWQVVPLIYADVGGRIMLHPAVGLDFKFETRTYWAVNVFSLKVSLVF